MFQNQLLVEHGSGPKASLRNQAVGEPQTENLLEQPGRTETELVAAMVPGENYTQAQHASAAGVLARGSTTDKGFFPKTVVTDIGSSWRQAAADNPAIQDKIMNGRPEESLAASQNLLQKVREGIDAQHRQALGTVANNPVNPKPIQDAVTFPQSLAGFAPDDAAAIADLKGRLGNIRTIGGLNDLRMYLNDELSQQFKMGPVAASRSGAVVGALQDALKVTRDLYYKELERTTGGDFQGLKRQEGSVLSAEEALQNAAPNLAKKQAIAEQPMSPTATVGEALQGAHTVSGSPIAGTARLIANGVLGQTPMTPIQDGLRNFFKFERGNPVPPSAPPTQYGQYVPSAATPAAPPTAATPAPRQLQPAGPPRVGGLQPAQLGVGTSQGNMGVPPPLTAAQQARLALGQADAQLGSGAGNPEFVTPGPGRVIKVSPAGQATMQRPSYPALNEATARTNVNAGTPRPAQEVIPQRTVNVSPEGQATIQRPALPPPETHAWSRSAWSKEHPNGNANAAEKVARGKGYRVTTDDD